MSDAALVIVGAVAVAAILISIFVLMRPTGGREETVVIRQAVRQPGGPYYQHIPVSHLVY
jgi:hypothetical protein